MSRTDIGWLSGEYHEVAARVANLEAELARAVRERNTVLAAMSEHGATYAEMTEATGMSPWRIRTALHNDWRERTARGQ